MTEASDSVKATDGVSECDGRHSLHAFAHFASLEQDGPFLVSEGSRCEVRDAEGRTYLDTVGGLWCTNIGLGRTEMADAIAEQVKKLAYSPIFGDMTHAPAAILAGKLAELAPGDLNRVHFVTGGSTANESAFRLIQFYQTCKGHPEKVHVIARNGSYHGSTYATMSIGNRVENRSPMFRYIEDIVHHVSAPYLYRAPQSMDEADYCDFLVKEFNDKIQEIGPDKVGGFFAEPVMGTAGALVPPAGYLKRIREVCRQHDILFVSDEVVTAFGRLGHWFASESEFGILPDIICSAKGLSSGYLPIGAMIYSDRIHDVITSEASTGTFPHGFTYGGHPVCCAAGLKNIEIMEREDLMAKAHDAGRYFGTKLKELEDLPLVGEVRGIGLMRCIEFVMDKDSKKLFPEEVGIGKRIANAAQESGLLIRPLGHLNIMSPPIIISRKQMDFVVEILRSALLSVHQTLLDEGWEPS